MILRFFFFKLTFYSALDQKTNFEFFIFFFPHEVLGISNGKKTFYVSCNHFKFSKMVKSGEKKTNVKTNLLISLEKLKNCKKFYNLSPFFFEKKEAQRKNKKNKNLKKNVFFYFHMLLIVSFRVYNGTLNTL